MSKNNNNGFIRLKFGPRWKYIACARSFIQNFLAISIEDNIRADKIAMAASELLENAVKYANSDTTDIFVNVDPQDEKIKVEVSNIASPEKINELKEIYSKLKAGEPQDVYISLMKIAATRLNGNSQLGLARIQYETGGELQLNIVGNNVTMAIDIK